MNSDSNACASEQVVGSQQAATKIQTAARGLLDRAFAARAAEQEQLFLGMKRQVELCPQKFSPCIAVPPQTHVCCAVSTLSLCGVLHASSVVLMLC